MNAPVFAPGACTTAKVEEAAGIAMLWWARNVECQTGRIPNNGPGKRTDVVIDESRLRELAETGMSGRDIAHQIGRSRDWVFRIASRHGLKIGRNRDRQSITNGLLLIEKMEKAE